MKRCAASKPDDQRIAHQVAADAGEKMQRALPWFAACTALGTLHQQRAGDHHDRQMDGQQDRNRHYSLLADDA
ncbi:hypothetical protein D9M72_365520 [compost metagenome]